MAIDINRTVVLCFESPIGPVGLLVGVVFETKRFDMVGCYGIRRFKIASGAHKKRNYALEAAGVSYDCMYCRWTLPNGSSISGGVHPALHGTLRALAVALLYTPVGSFCNCKSRVLYVTVYSIWPR